MNHHKCLIVVIIVILLSMTIGSCFSINKSSRNIKYPCEKRIELFHRWLWSQEEWNHTFGGVSLDIGTGVKPVAGGGISLPEPKTLRVTIMLVIVGLRKPTVTGVLNGRKHTGVPIVTQLKMCGRHQTGIYHSRHHELFWSG